MTELLAQHFNVTGFDLSLKQLRLGKNRDLGVEFVCTDIANLPVRGKTYDAVCSYYAIIHIPRNEHRQVLDNFVGILKPGGLALLCMGAGDLPEDISRYHDAPMFWSHFGLDSNLKMMKESGLRVLWSRRIVDPTDPRSVHLFVLAEKQS